MSVEAPRTQTLSGKAATALCLAALWLALAVLPLDFCLIPTQFTVVLGLLLGLASAGLALSAAGEIRRRAPRAGPPSVASLGLLAVSAALALWPLLRDRADAVVLSGWSANPRVQNGRAYDRVALDVITCDAVIVPKDARVERGSAAGRVEVYMVKGLAF